MSVNMEKDKIVVKSDGFHGLHGLYCKHCELDCFLIQTGEGLPEKMHYCPVDGKDLRVIGGSNGEKWENPYWRKIGD